MISGKLEKIGEMSLSQRIITKENQKDILNELISKKL